MGLADGVIVESNSSTFEQFEESPLSHDAAELLVAGLDCK
jgi:hypothetical protein